MITIFNDSQKKYPGLDYIFSYYLHQDWLYCFDTQSIVEVLKMAAEDRTGYLYKVNDIFKAPSLESLHTELLDITKKSPEEQFLRFKELQSTGLDIHKYHIGLLFATILYLTEQEMRKQNIEISNIS